MRISGYELESMEGKERNETLLIFSYLLDREQSVALD